MKHYVILNRLPNERLNYEAVIDHVANQVTYIGHFSPSYIFRGPATLIEADLAALDPCNLPASIHAALLECDQLIARAEFDLLLAGSLREHYNIPGDTRIDVLPIRDKLLMRRMAGEHSLRQPKFWSLDQFCHQDLEHGKFVLKPKLDASSNGVMIAGRAEVLAKIATISQPHEWLVEAHIAGDVHHIDGFLEQSRVRVIQQSKYLNTCLDYATGTPLGSAQIPTAAWVTSLTEQIASALNYRDGSFHLEVIISEADGLPYFLEFAGRVGGSFVGDSFELKTGVNLHRCDLQLLVGKSQNWQQVHQDSRYFGWFVFPYGTTVAEDFNADQFESQLHLLVRNHTPAAPAATSYLQQNSPLSGIVHAQQDCDEMVLAVISAAAVSA